MNMKATQTLLLDLNSSPQWSNDSRPCSCNLAVRVR